MPPSSIPGRAVRGLSSFLGGLVVLGLTWGPACTKEPTARVPSTDPASGSDYVGAASDEPALATEAAAEPAAPAGGPTPRILAADVGGEHDELVGGERLRAEYEPGDPWLGAAQPAVTIVAFLDYQCPYSKRLVPTLYELAELYSDDLRVVIKHNPLPMHGNARFAATAAIAAMQQGRFWVMNDALFENQTALDRPAVLGYANRLGFDLPRFEAALDDAKTGERVDADAAQAQRLGARATPSMFINGRFLSGALPLSDLRTEVQTELDAAQRLLDGGVPRPHLYATFMHAAKEAAPSPARPSTSGRLADDVRREVVTTGLPQRGAKDPKVVIVECSDFDCPFCGRVQETLAQLLANHPSDVALFYRHLPLKFHPGAEPAARAAVAAQAQGKFWKLHDLLFQNPRERTEADLERLARKAGVSVKKWRKAFNSPETAARVQAESDACSANGVNGTPGFLINGRLLSGAQPLESFEQVVQEELARGR